MMDSTKENYDRLIKRFENMEYLPETRAEENGWDEHKLYYNNRRFMFDVLTPSNVFAHCAVEFGHPIHNIDDTVEFTKSKLGLSEREVMWLHRATRPKEVANGLRYLCGE